MLRVSYANDSCFIQLGRQNIANCARCSQKLVQCSAKWRKPIDLSRNSLLPFRDMHKIAGADLQLSYIYRWIYIYSCVCHPTA